jgi:DNA-binding GntR family transcriptional regulator
VSAIRSIEFTPDLTEQVHRRLLDAISDCELAPGTRLTQEELAASLNVSRQPVLQALRLLRKEGFVIDAGRRGLMVAPLDPEAIRHIYEVRSVLDGLAARLAALAGAKLDEGLIADGRRAAAGTRIGTMIDADLKFHNAIYSASGNPFVGETANHHWRHIRRAMGAVLRRIGTREYVWDEHAAILAAINLGDADLAERLACSHGASAGRNLTEHMIRHAREAS